MRSLSRWWPGHRGRALSCVLVICLAAAGATQAAAAPATPQSRLLDVWLDLRLVAMFYPDTTAKSLLSNLAKVARQLGQPLPPIRFGETARDTRKFRVGAVMIKRHPPPDTWILFTRSRSHVWKLTDDVQGRLKLVRVASP